MRRHPARAGRRFASPAALALLLALLAPAAVGCGQGATAAAPPVPTSQPTISPSVDATRLQLDGALRARGIVMQATNQFVQPGEPPSLGDVPRTAFRAVLPGDPSGGLIVVYDLPDSAVAATRAAELAAHVASGPGRIQYPPDARFVIRQVGATIVFFPWSPSSSPDPKTADVAAAVATVGTEVPIPPG